jgi:hypothetical protein
LKKEATKPAAQNFLQQQAKFDDFIRSRRPYRHANRLPMQVEKLIVRLKRDRPSWGAPKIREKLRRLHSDIQTPAISTVHAVLYRHGLVNRGRKRRHKAEGTALSRPLAPNDLWCADYKGEFMLADRRYCYPLTSSSSTTRNSITTSSPGFRTKSQSSTPALTSAAGHAPGTSSIR